MPPRTRSEAERTGNGGRTRQAEPAAESRTEQAGEGRAAGGQRSATLNLPFVTAEFHAPDHLVPTRDDVVGAARGVRSILPSGKSALFYGGLAATAALGVLEWPVAAAIGVGTALANRGAVDPRPVRQTRSETTDRP